MAKKTRSRLSYEERRNNKQHESPSDEITLRDEIFKLKQEMMILKKTNEQYLVKLRKYEDEIKRKDKYFEQLMDPRKNSDITKVLSTKGAAILMNLKDQNNSLIQMILNKDLCIRRLVAQIKMSKLYASTRKNESYRMEINRLRNLLVKSQEMLKENVDVRQQERSICLNGDPLLEFSSSSDQSSPRDLDELRLTILNLESHIKCSNDLLAEKNQKISLLTEELNFLRKFFHSKTSKNRAFVSDFMNTESHKFSGGNFPSAWPDRTVSTKVSSQNVFSSYEKNTNHENDSLPHSAPAALQNWLSVPKYNCQLQILEQKTENIETNEEPVVNMNRESYEEAERSASLFEKTLFHNLASDAIKKEETIFSNSKKEFHTKEKWKKALIKYKELRQLNSEIFDASENDKKTFIKKENYISKYSTADAEELKKTGGENQVLEEEQIDPEDSPENADSPELFISETNENRSRTPSSVSDNSMNDIETLQNSAKTSSVLHEDENKSTPKSENNEELQIFSDSGTFEETNLVKTKAQKEIYSQSSDSSFDSENSYSIKQIQVEVQINSVPSHNGKARSEKHFLENNLIFESCKENGGNDAPDLDFNDDDDDVIVCEK